MQLTKNFNQNWSEFYVEFKNNFFFNIIYY